MEALKRRQEKELSKIVEREQTMASLQQKLKHAEEEEKRKKKIHDKKVAEEKIIEEKKRVQREQELKKLEQEEIERKRELARKEAEVEEKLKKLHLQQVIHRTASPPASPDPVIFCLGALFDFSFV